MDGSDGDAIDQLAADVNGAVNQTREQSEIVRDAGLSFLAYEGGQPCYTNAETVNVRPEMYQIYIDYFELDPVAARAADGEAVGVMLPPCDTRVRVP